MTTQEVKKVETIIDLIAQKEGKETEVVRQAMQEALDAAWATAWQPGNIRAQAKWQQLFGPRKPSLEEFIMRCATNI